MIRPGIALGRLARIGSLLGDPRRRAANLFLSLQDVLPDRYVWRTDRSPIAIAFVRAVVGRSHVRRGSALAG
jgi:hypothetical protein